MNANIFFNGKTLQEFEDLTTENKNPQMGVWNGRLVILTYQTSTYWEAFFVKIQQLKYILLEKMNFLNKNPEEISNLKKQVQEYYIQQMTKMSHHPTVDQLKQKCDEVQKAIFFYTKLVEEFSQLTSFSQIEKENEDLLQQKINLCNTLEERKQKLEFEIKELIEKLSLYEHLKTQINKVEEEIKLKKDELVEIADDQVQFNRFLEGKAVNADKLEALFGYIYNIADIAPVKTFVPKVMKSLIDTTIIEAVLTGQAVVHYH